MKIGIIFGGFSREREVSFAGGRTVYDNLNKALFEPVPLFIDSFGRFVLLDWQYIYKGSIRDFYPPTDLIPESIFQVYAENLEDLTPEKEEALLAPLGKIIKTEDLHNHIDFAFLALHGTFGEDGKIQGLLEYLKIPYSGAGIFASAFGINKAIQKPLMYQAGLNTPDYYKISQSDWLKTDPEETMATVGRRVGFPVVIKAAHQGSSIGVTILHKADVASFKKAVDMSFFRVTISGKEWNSLSNDEKKIFIQTQADFREGIGLPVIIEGELIRHPETLLSFLDKAFADGKTEVTMASADGESEVLFEEMIKGREFSCIVIRGLDGQPVALPPTEVTKGQEVFDYRSKYLPGLSRKITPIPLPHKEIDRIRLECKGLFEEFRFQVYARIDGFYTAEGKIYLNDPNTTSGMMPSSFFFHQAAEIGLNPSQFLTFIIHASLRERQTSGVCEPAASTLLHRLDQNLDQFGKTVTHKKKVAVIFGGYSTERHISVESGRNIYEKLSSSTKYEPIPVFLTGKDHDHQMYRIPINIMLKDNADDIREKIEHQEENETLEEIKLDCIDITRRFTDGRTLIRPTLYTFDELEKDVDAVFIALHGRPGEDGQVQQELTRRGIPFNGSGSESSSVTINKFETNEKLRNEGLLIPNHILVQKAHWESDQKEATKEILAHLSFPIIAKPADDGCSSAVKVIRTVEQLNAFAEMIFRKELPLPASATAILNIKPKEEVPMKDFFVVEEMINKGEAKHFLEVTGGLLTHYNENGEIEYEIFEPSESLATSEVLSLEEKFLAGEGQNITPSRFSRNKTENARISVIVREELKRTAKTMNVEGYARIDAFVKIYEDGKVDVIIIEINSLPGMTPATCIFHQTALNNYKPYNFIDQILEFGIKRNNRS